MDWTKQVEQWSAPPVGGSNIPSSKILEMSDEALDKFINQVWPSQYRQPSNWQGLYRRLLKLDTTNDKEILDFGCGFGMDALSLAYNNYVGLADISEDNVKAAAKIMRSRGFAVAQEVLVANEPPYFECEPVDIFHCSGVLHHIPWRVDLLKRMCEFLKPDGEIRALLYSDFAWFDVVGGPVLPDVDADSTQHPKFQHWVRTMDAVGEYSDWFSREKLVHEVGGFLKVIGCDYIRPDSWYLVATMKPK